MVNFVEGHSTCADEASNVTEINVGDMVYFPATSLGMRDIKTSARP